MSAGAQACEGGLTRGAYLLRILERGMVPAALGEFLPGLVDRDRVVVDHSTVAVDLEDVGRSDDIQRATAERSKGQPVAVAGRFRREPGRAACTESNGATPRRAITWAISASAPCEVIGTGFAERGSPIVISSTSGNLGHQVLAGRARCSIVRARLAESRG